jgi:nicotinate-nucleotide adenylyltransferase
MRIAFFGGTFDPPHRGHLAIARAAADALSLDTVLFAPTGQQPLKRNQRTFPYADRRAMVALACAYAEDPRFGVTDLDAPKPDGSPNYTVHSLEELALQYPFAERFNLAGADSFRGMGQWREPHSLLALAEWIVVSRPGFALDQVGGTLEDPSGIRLTSEERARIHVLGSVHEDVSATELRKRLAQGLSTDDLLPPPVAAYIAAHNLYRGEQF